MKTSNKNKNISSEFDFFLTNPLTQFEGQYVAILGKKVISHGSSAKKVWEQAKKKYPKSLPTIAKIPKKEILIMIWK